MKINIILKEAKGSDKMMRKDAEKDPSAIYNVDELVGDFERQFPQYLPLQILQNKYNPFLGEGAQGKVYAVQSGGRIYALKLSSKVRHYDSENEYQIRKNFGKIYNQMPQEIQKHFPKIYKIGEWKYGEGVPKDLWDENQLYQQMEPFYYYVMELLMPLDAEDITAFQIMDKSQGQEHVAFMKKDFSKKQAFSFSDFEKVYNIAKKMLLTGVGGISVFGTQISHYTESNISFELKNKLIDVVKNKKNIFLEPYLDGFYKIWKDNIIKQNFQQLKTEREIALYSETLAKLLTKQNDAIIKQLASEMLSDSKEKTNINSLYNKLKAIFTGLNLQIFKTILNPKIGLDILPGDLETTEEAGAVKSLHDALRILARDYEIDITDIKESNIMKRKDGTLVVTDIGVWGFED